VPQQPRTIDKYDVIRRLDRTGMSTVYLGRDRRLERLVAIKVIREGFEDDGARARFLQEAKTLSQLRHPNIVTIFDSGEVDGQPFIVMDYIAGLSLADVIHRRQALTVRQRLELLDQVCAGMAYAHEHSAHIVHRDLKPSNIRIDRESGLIKILDFGISKQLEHNGSSRYTQGLGTPAYMAPEQISTGRVDVRSDIFSLGTVSYELLSYQRAFDGETIWRIRDRIVLEEPRALDLLCPDLDPAIISVVTTALMKDPAARYQELRSMRSDIQRALTTVPSEGLLATPGCTLEAAGPDEPASESSLLVKSGDVEAADESYEAASPPPSTRRKLYAGAGVALVALLVGGLTVRTLWYRNARTDVSSEPQRRAAQLRDTARQQWQRGQRREALSTLEQALSLHVDDAAKYERTKPTISLSAVLILAKRHGIFSRCWLAAVRTR
jgi:serine/threonine protein kinase